MSEHAKLSPSSAHRWLLCPASAAESQKVVTPDTEYSTAGAARHAVTAEWLTTGQPPAAGSPVPGMDIPVTAEMLDDVAEGVEWVVAYKARTLMVEERTNIAPVFGLEPGTCFGTIDVLGLKADELLILDHKFGRVSVPVVENPQLMLYAAGAMEEMGWLWPKVRLVINQPRQEGITEHVVTKEVLRAWIDLVTPAVVIAASEGAPFVPGEEQCRYCPAAGICKALQDQTLALARQEFGMVEHISIDQLAEILQKADLIEAAIKAAREHALKLAMSGRPVPGYKVVESKRHRQWSDEAKAVEYLVTLGYDADDYAPRKMKSPAQVEKLAGKQVVEGLTQVPKGEPVLAPESDKRPAYSGPFESLAAVAGMLE